MPSTKRKRRELPALTPGDALEMLASAINYCQHAGLKVRAGNMGNGMLAIVVEGAAVASTDGVTRLVVASTPPQTPPPKAGEGTQV